MITKHTIADPMPDSAATVAQHLRIIRKHVHRDCVMCSPANPRGVALQCVSIDSRTVVADFQPEAWMVGYDNRLHGGIVAALLDSAMTQCLFAQGKHGVTALLNIRYRHPAPILGDYHIRAVVTRSHGSRHHMFAQLLANDLRIAEANALFVDDAAVVQPDTSRADSPS